MLSQRSKILAQYLYVLSLIFVYGSFFLAFTTYNIINPLIIGYKLYNIQDYIWFLIPAGAIFYFLLFVFGMYLNLNIKDFKSDTVKLFEITVIAVFLIYAGLFMLKITYISRLLIGYFAIYSFLSLILADYIGRKLAKGLKRRGYSIRNILLVTGNANGGGNTGVKETVKSQEYLGIKLVKEINKSDLNGLEDFVLNNPVDEVIFDIKGNELADIKDIALLLEEKGITVKILTNFMPLKYSKVSFEKLGGFPVLSFYTTPEDDMKLFAKRVLDISGSIAAIIIFFMPAVIIAFLIKLTSKGTVLYKSKRVGKNGRLFTFYKFRTMYAGSDKLRDELIQERSKDGIEIKIKDDPRITGIGGFLRKTSLDELPQFYNVLRGDMSLVGPRPPMPDEVKKYSIRQRRRISMKPGITCLWQISGRSGLSFSDRVELDLKYIDNWSLKLDFVILLKTVPAVLFAKGAL
ncbi:MAG: sugar transferase [Deltaproteobacteria bacterium]|nr:sugar transferase [Deltaproteobacteria bacterium]